MHRILAILFLCISTALAWWAMELQGRLRFKDKELLALRTERDAAKADVRPLLENVARLQKERDAAIAPAGKSDAEDPSSGLLAGLLKELDSPELKSVMRSQQLAEARQEYAPLLKRWSLSLADADVVLNFLADKEAGDLPGFFSAVHSAPEDWESAFEMQTAEGKVRLKSVLGAVRMKELEVFEQKQERTKAVRRYSEHLDITGFPLTTEQQTQLADAIVKVESGTAALADETEVDSPGAFDDETIAKISRGEEGKQMRVIQKAKTFLSPDQVSGLQSAFREENQEREAGMKMIGQVMKEGRGGKVPTQPK